MTSRVITVVMSLVISRLELPLSVVVDWWRCNRANSANAVAASHGKHTSSQAFWQYQK
jgi:hypothetical protein